MCALKAFTNINHWFLYTITLKCISFSFRSFFFFLSICWYFFLHSLGTVGPSFFSFASSVVFRSCFCLLLPASLCLLRQTSATINFILLANNFPLSAALLVPRHVSSCDYLAFFFFVVSFVFIFFSSFLGRALPPFSLTKPRRSIRGRDQPPSSLLFATSYPVVVYIASTAYHDAG